MNEDEDIHPEFVETLAELMQEFPDFDDDDDDEEPYILGPLDQSLARLDRIKARKEERELGGEGE